MKQMLFAAALCSWLAFPVMAEEAEKEIRATTSKGESIVLQPDGSWNYANPAQAKEEEKNRAAVSGECPQKSQGGFFGTRCILPGDKDFNRGSLSGKGR
ncbi:hypothetical protein LG201_09200 [Methylobacillus gramineus]|uniref:hypothetical protein n=1 Tax=Methylobacillus gramineus TaxID=755169 RepID=UPI001CFFFD07|nr:hypothetical protein [Methylobacillus gramineus]MCB5185379.1 hypothetical protein [Methylobacillus gramineus]